MLFSTTSQDPDSRAASARSVSKRGRGGHRGRHSGTLLPMNRSASRLHRLAGSPRALHCLSTAKTMALWPECACSEPPFLSSAHWSAGGRLTWFPENLCRERRLCGRAATLASACFVLFWGSGLAHTRLSTSALSRPHIAFEYLCLLRAVLGKWFRLTKLPTSAGLHVAVCWWLVAGLRFLQRSVLNSGMCRFEALRCGGCHAHERTK